MVLPEGLNMPSENTMLSINDMLEDGVRSSSGINVGQLNGMPDICMREMNGADAFENTPAGNANNNLGEGSGDVGEQPVSPINRKKKYKRHTKEQLEGLEGFFEQCAHPSELQRLDLAFELELEPHQIKFWFQNKRTQLKLLHDKSETTFLREENERLKEENKKLKEAYSNAICIKYCNSSNPPEEWPNEAHQLTISNYLLKKQIKKLLKRLAASKAQIPLVDLTIDSPPLTPHPLEQYNPPEQQNLHHTFMENNYGPTYPLEPIQGPVNINNNDITAPELNNIPLEQNITLDDEDMILLEETFGLEGPLGPIQGPENIDNIEVITEETCGPVSPLGPIQGPVNIDNMEMVTDVGPLQTPRLSEPDNIQDLIMEDTNGPVNLIGPIQGPANLGNAEMIIDLAVSAMKEFVTMACSDFPLWLREENNSSFVLNKTEYSKVFLNEIEPNPMGFGTEVSKDTVIVLLSANDLVNILMDETQWSTVFSGVIASATTLEIISAGGRTSYHNALYLMKAEFQVLSPTVQTRESYFLRYCWNHSDGSWTVTDISLDDNWQLNNNSVRCRRKPSGCLIEEMPNGHSKVTWVEHVQVDDQNVLDLYKTFVHSGLAFGAKRWTSILKRHCQFLYNTVQLSIGDKQITIVPYMNGTIAMLRLAKRMEISFHNGASSSTAQQWTLLPDFEFPNIRLMMRKSINDPGHPSGIVLSAASSFSIQTPHERVFGYLRNHQFRHQWDSLADGKTFQEVSNVPDADEEWNCFSLLRVFSPGEKQKKMMLLQQSHSDQTGSFITYTYVNSKSITAVLQGRDPRDLEILPLGFAIFPDGSVTATGSRACLVTISFQLLLSSNPNVQITKELVTPARNLITATIGRIKDSLGS